MSKLTDEYEIEGENIGALPEHFFSFDRKNLDIGVDALPENDDFLMLCFLLAQQERRKYETSEKIIYPKPEANEYQEYTFSCYKHKLEESKKKLIAFFERRGCYVIEYDYYIEVCYELGNLVINFHIREDKNENHY